MFSGPQNKIAICSNFGGLDLGLDLEHLYVGFAVAHLVASESDRAEGEPIGAIIVLTEVGLQNRMGGRVFKMVEKTVFSKILDLNLVTLDVVSVRWESQDHIAALEIDADLGRRLGMFAGTLRIAKLPALVEVACPCLVMDENGGRTDGKPFVLGDAFGSGKVCVMLGSRSSYGYEGQGQGEEE